MFLGILRCMVLRHEPDRRRIAKASDETYRSQCEHCGVPLRRIRRNHWVRSHSRR